MVFDEKAIGILEQISEGMPGGFIIYHADGNEELIYANSAILHIFGCDTMAQFKELTGYTFPGMVHPEDVEAVEKSIENQIRSSQYDLDYVEYRIIQRDGSIRWVEDYGHFVHTEGYGDVFYVFLYDATERLKKRMRHLETINDELREAYARESQYRKAILHDAILFFEVNLTKDEIIAATWSGSEEGHKDVMRGTAWDGTVQRFSDYVLAWEGNVDSESIEEYHRFFDIEHLVKGYEKGGLEQTCDIWMNNVHGRKCLCHYIFLFGTNKHTGDVVALAVAKDVTEQLERQNLLQSALIQAHSASVAKNTFLLNMSHDIRTPLNAVIGYTELLQNGRPDADKVEDYLDKIRKSSEQLLAIVNESLEVTRMESGKVSLAKRECRLDELLKEVEKSVLPIMKKKNIRFTLDMTEVKHFAVLTDFVRMRELLLQLLDNAAKYTDCGGAVALTAAETDLTFSGYGKYRFVVEDNGIGISKEFQKELFEPFKREYNTTHSGVLGVGLGLTVVKNLVSMMEGDIEVESAPGQGSRFTVHLLFQLQEEQKSPDNAVRLPKKSPHESRLLIVEDNEINYEIAEELLKAKGYIVEGGAPNGKAACEKIKNSEPGYYSCVLMDIQMPVMDGYEATRAIRRFADPELAQIPIIALSANTFAEDYENSIEAGMNAHFPKPIDIDGLHELIQKVLSESHIVR